MGQVYSFIRGSFPPRPPLVLYYGKHLIHVPNAPEFSDKDRQEVITYTPCGIAIFDALLPVENPTADLRAFAHELSVRTWRQITDGFRARDALARAATRTLASGTSTACLLTVTKEKLDVINVGDSACIIVRDGEIIGHTEPRSRVDGSPLIMCRQADGKRIDYIGAATEFSDTAHEDDFICMASDGFWRWMNIHEVLDNFKGKIGEFLLVRDELNAHPTFVMTQLACHLANEAKARAMQGQNPTPGNWNELDEDITVICAWVLRRGG